MACEDLAAGGEFHHQVTTCNLKTWILEILVEDLPSDGSWQRALRTPLASRPLLGFHEELLLPADLDAQLLPPAGNHPPGNQPQHLLLDGNMKISDFEHLWLCWRR